MKHYLSNPSVGVVLACYNGEAWIDEAIKSVLSQTYKFLKLYIVDDGSSDNTVSIINYYAANYPERVLIIPKIGIKGAPSSRVEAVSNIDDDLVAFIDQDDIWLNDKIEAQVAHMRREKISLSFTDIEIIDHEGKIQAESSRRENIKRSSFFCSANTEELTRNLFIYCPIRIGTVLMTKKSFLDSGGFDVSLFGGEDWEFWVRHAAFGNFIGHLPKITALRRIHSKNTSYKYRIERLNNWLKAALQVSQRFHYLKKDLNSFYRLTFYRTIISCLKKNDHDGKNNVIRLFKAKKIIFSIDVLLANFISMFWTVVFPVFQILTKVKDKRFLLFWKFK